MVAGLRVAESDGWKGGSEAQCHYITVFPPACAYVELGSDSYIDIQIFVYIYYILICTVYYI